MATPVPVRIPEEWSSAWFRVFYNEVLFRQTGSAPSASSVTAAIAAHNTDPNAHANLSAGVQANPVLAWFLS